MQSYFVLDLSNFSSSLTSSLPGWPAVECRRSVGTVLQAPTSATKEELLLDNLNLGVARSSPSPNMPREEAVFVLVVSSVGSGGPAALIVYLPYPRG